MEGKWFGEVRVQIVSQRKSSYIAMTYAIWSCFFDKI